MTDDIEDKKESLAKQDEKKVVISEPETKEQLRRREREDQKRKTIDALKQLQEEWNARNVPSTDKTDNKTSEKRNKEEKIGKRKTRRRKRIQYKKDWGKDNDHNGPQ